MLEYQNIETFSKGYEEVFEERLTKTSYKKQINKITIEKVTNRKDNKLYVKQKSYDFNNWIDKKISLYKNDVFSWTVH